MASLPNNYECYLFNQITKAYLEKKTMSITEIMSLYNMSVHVIFVS